MSRGNNLQEMEVGTKQSKTAVNAGAKAAEAMPHLSGSTPGQTGGWEDLGGPDPSNYRSTDDSAKLKTPGVSLKQVRDVVNKGAGAAEAMKGVKEDEEFEYDEDEELLEDTEEVTEAKHNEEANKLIEYESFCINLNELIVDIKNMHEFTTGYKKTSLNFSKIANHLEDLSTTLTAFEHKLKNIKNDS